MKKRLGKKREKQYERYDLYAGDVMAEVSNPPLGFDRPSYRGVLCQLPELTPVLLNTDNMDFFRKETIKACRRYRLQYCAYRYGPPDSCLIIVSPVKYANIYEASYNNLSDDIPLAHYKVLQTGRHTAMAKQCQTILEDLLSNMSERSVELMNMPIDSAEESSNLENPAVAKPSW